MPKIDYTDSQTEPIKKVKGAAHITEAEHCSKEAELLFKATYGFRNRFNHIKATTMATGPFHFSNKWQTFLRFENNITIFYRQKKPVGWLYHREILEGLIPCPFDGKDLNSDLHPMETYSPTYAT